MNNVPDFTLTLDPNEKDPYKLSRIIINHIYYIGSWFFEALGLNTNYLAVNKKVYHLIKLYNFVHIYENFNLDKVENNELIGFLMNFHVIYNDSLIDEFLIGRIKTGDEKGEKMNDIDDPEIKLQIKINF